MKGGEKDEKELQVTAHIITMYMQWYLMVHTVWFVAKQPNMCMCVDDKGVW